MHLPGRVLHGDIAFVWQHRPSSFPLQCATPYYHTSVPHVSRRYKNILPITIALHGWCVLLHQQGDQSFPEKKNFDAPFQASITASATLDPFGLAHSSS